MNTLFKINLKRLYHTVQQIQIKNPWDFNDEIGIVAVTLTNRKTPYFCVFPQDSIVLLPNVAALKGLFLMSEQSNMPDIQRMRYQQHLAIYFEPIQHLSDQEQQWVQDLEIQPINGLYPMFESALVDLIPEPMVEKELTTVLDITKSLLFALENYTKQPLSNYDVQQQMIQVAFNFESKKWENQVVDLPDLTVLVQPLKIFDDIIDQINQMPKNNQVWELDIAYTAILAQAKQGHRQAVVKVLVLADHQNELIYDQKLITIQDQAHEQLMSLLVASLLEKGKPKQILVRDIIIESLLKELSQACKLQIKISQQLAIIDHFVEQLTQQSVGQL